MNRKILFVVIAAALIAVAGILAISGKGPSGETTQVATVTAERIAEMETGAGDSEQTGSSASDTAIVAEEEIVDRDNHAEAPPSLRAGVDLDGIMAVRAVGDPDAPVVIEEFASLTCSHCAHFYLQTYPALKEKYVDTGQVYFIYTDFPLNPPALEASAVARCLPHDRYFRFIGFLFETQDNWAYDRNYSNYLKQNAKLLGLSEEAYEACAQNRDIREALADEMKAKSGQYDVQSTPTFVINGREKIVGAQSLATFEKLIRAELAKSAQTE